MKIGQIPMCCGAFIISDLGGTTCTLGKETPEDLETLDKKLKSYINRYGMVSFIMCILNKEQTDEFGSTLEKNGFEPARVGYNNNHNSDLTLFVRTNKE